MIYNEQFDSDNFRENFTHLYSAKNDYFKFGFGAECRFFVTNKL